jgi:hypothetical protein
LNIVSVNVWSLFYMSTMASHFPWGCCIIRLAQFPAGSHYTCCRNCQFCIRHLLSLCGFHWSSTCFSNIYIYIYMCVCVWCACVRAVCVCVRMCVVCVRVRVVCARACGVVCVRVWCVRARACVVWCVCVFSTATTRSGIINSDKFPDVPVPDRRAI